MPEIKGLILPQLIVIAKLIHGFPEGYSSIISVLLPVVQRLLMDPSADISEKAAASLASIAELLKTEDRGDHVLTIVLSTPGETLYG
ncbi:MAG: hypothetical protein P4L67_02610 [Candidatus Pacebacteria bacterium]|nr:hypothetical protein [Candidatus Paceibacterota bacterium]